MGLSQIKDVVSAYSEAIAKILEIDVVIVDDCLERVGNTHYYPDDPIPITKMSIIGQVVRLGKVVTLEDKSSYFTCQQCSSSSKCQITGFIGVPIFGEDEIIGGICLLITNKRKSMFLSLKNHIDFLEKMAELLAAKYISIVKYNELEASKREQEFVMNAIENSIISTGNSGIINYYNRKFGETFGVTNDCIGKNIKEIINDSLITDMLKHSDAMTSSKFISYRNSNFTKSFYGFVKCIPKINNEQKEGYLFHFTSVNQVGTELNEISDNKTSVLFDGFISEGNFFKQILDKAKRLSILDDIVLICGEKGTEKDVIAKAIHNFSNRSNGYFLTFDCCNHVSEDFENELFGSDKFILSKYIGKLHLAHNGTLYLRFVEELPLYMQEKLVIFLKTGIIKDGHSDKLKLDIRLVCSSNEDLAERVKKGLFNEDLYYLISQNTLMLPPLRCYSKNDFQHTVITYSKKSQQIQNKSGITFSLSAAEYLYNHPWAGNVLELQKCIDTLVFKYSGEITVERIAEILDGSIIRDEHLKSIQQIEKSEIEKLINENKSKGEIAKILNIGRATLYRKIKKYNITI